MRRVVELFGLRKSNKTDLFRREMEVMKKFLVLTAVAMLTVTSVGCRQCSWFRQGSLFPRFSRQAEVYCDPCDPCGVCSDCCTTTGSFELAPPTLLPGPGGG